MPGLYQHYNNRSVNMAAMFEHTGSQAVFLNAVLVCCDDELHSSRVTAGDGHGPGVLGVTVPCDAPTKAHQHLLDHVLLMAPPPESPNPPESLSLRVGNTGCIKLRSPTMGHIHTEAAVKSIDGDIPGTKSQQVANSSGKTSMYRRTSLRS